MIEPVVDTATGPVRGRRTESGHVYYGVPYAAAPVRDLRFAAPQPHPAWTEPRDTREPGPTAPQPQRGSFGRLDMTPYFGPGWIPGEDYLTVNIWTPAHAPAPAPVMVFIHGGGFIAGSGTAPLLDGAAFARDGVLLVTLNYRLGIPGFLHLSDAPDNRGLLDIVAALHWLRANITRFGGDPTNITLAGQSAGAILVAAALTHPPAAGLFHRAVMQSGTGTGAFTPDQGERITTAVGRELGISPTAATLSRYTDAGLLHSLSTVDIGTSHPLGGITPLGVILEEQPSHAATAGRAARVPLLIGANRDEGALYSAPFDLDSTSADSVFTAGTASMTAAHSQHALTYSYTFTWRSNALNGRLTACHTLELPFVFDNLHLPALHGPGALLGTTPPPRQLAYRVHTAWIRYARTGTPGWAPFNPLVPAAEILGPPPGRMPRSVQDGQAVYRG